MKRRRQRKVKCPKCKGKGVTGYGSPVMYGSRAPVMKVAGGTWATCPYCGGSGKVEEPER